MQNAEIISGFRQLCRYLYFFLVETLPNWLNWMTSPLINVINENGYLRFLYDLWTAILPDSVVENFNSLVQSTSIAQFLVGGALGLVLTFSLVRAIIKLFVGTL